MTIVLRAARVAEPGAALERVLPLDPHITRALVLEVPRRGAKLLRGHGGHALVRACWGAWLCAGGALQRGHLGLLTAIASFLPLLGHLAVWLALSVVTLAFQGHLLPAVRCWLGFFIVMALSDYFIVRGWWRRHSRAPLC